MKLNILLVISWLMFLLINISQAQTKKIQIMGYVDSNITRRYATGELVIRIAETTSTVTKNGENYTLAISPDGSFRQDLNVKNSIVYVSFEFEDKSASNWTGRFYNASFPKNRSLPEVYLFEAGDSVSVDIKDNGKLFFSGKGSEKLNCGWQMYNIDPLEDGIMNRSVDLLNKKDLQGALLLQDKALKTKAQLRVLLLQSYKNELSKEIYDLLYTDALALGEHEIYYNLPYIYSSLPNEKDRAFIEKYALSLPNAQAFHGMDSNIRAKSAYYANMIFEKEMTYLRFSSSSKSYNTGNSFGSIYGKLKNNYSGLLRDKLLLICFQKTPEFFQDESKRFYDDAIKTVSNPVYKEFLEENRHRNTTAFPFELYDQNDKIHKLTDYKGKVVVMDFWFTGCGPCLELAKGMKSVVEKYKNNKNIVFITVSTDQKKLWLESVTKGLYTSQGMVNLHTNGKGFNDPLIKNYNFTGFPQQLIIDKKNELVILSPLRPINNENTKKFEKIIDDTLSR